MEGRTIKQRKIFIVSVLVLCIISIIIFIVQASNVKQIDNPIIKSSLKEIATTKTTFLYKSVLKRKHNFYVNADNILNSINSVSVSPNEELKINFKQKPSSYFVVRRLDNGNYENVFQVKEGDMENKYIITPNEQGKYIYSISASYPEGLGIYYFSITVN